MFKKTILKNGLRVLTIPMESTQAITVLVLVGTGSKYEKKEINGISHFLEHLYFKGTKKRPTSLDIAETLDKVGGIYNAFTGEEYTGYFAKVAYNNFELALDWVSDIFLNSILPEKEIEKERGVVIEEINMTYDNPMNYIQNLWMELLYGNQPAGWPITGSKETMSKISHQDLIDYRGSQYVAENTIVVVAGRVNQNKVLEKVKKYFSAIKKSKSFRKEKVVENQKGPQLLLRFRKTDQTHLSLGVRGYNIFHPKRYVQELLAVILGGMMSSRLFTIIRGKLGMAYYINTEAEADPDTGYLVTQTGVDTQKLETAISAILGEYKKISQIKVQKDELQKAKNYFKGRLSLLLESSDAQASFYAGQELLEKKISSPKEIFAKIDRIKSDDIREVAADIFQPSKLNLALIGPFKNKEKFKRLLKL
jgi:predicted Zn-dependent peptidase